VIKPYQRIAIVESHEPLVAIPADRFSLVSPHPYAKLGAPYGEKSPFYLRQGVLDRLHQAQQQLQHLRPGWQIQVFDAYRPVPVQQFMVDYTLGQVLAARGQLTPTPEQQESALAQVYQFWAKPNWDPLMPPPHSTGAALDITLIDDQGREVDMGCPIDELSPRSHPDHFVGLADPVAEKADRHRQLLNFCMRQAGFQRHYHEWWHFSWGDQLWAWLESREKTDQIFNARYGRVEDAGNNSIG
jgi:zinc D-Ala-D-Ala dipeptidase